MTLMVWWQVALIFLATLFAIDVIFVAMVARFIKMSKTTPRAPLRALDEDTDQKWDDIVKRWEAS